MTEQQQQQQQNIEDPVDQIRLHNGVLMPKLAFGCAFGNWAGDGWKGFTPEEGWAAFPAAFRAGFRHFDTALVYNTHQILAHSIGKEFAEGRLKRKDLFITSKVFHPPADLALNHLNTTIDISRYLDDSSLDLKPRIIHDVERCLAELNLGYLDLILLHWPGAFNTSDAEKGARVRLEAWRALEEVYKAGQVRAIGVSNFLPKHLEPLIKECSVLPMVNQVEISPYFQQREIIKFCRLHKVILQAWGPFGSGATGVLSDATINEIAGKHGKNAGQVILRWLVQKNITAAPKSSSEERMKSNLDIFDFSLSEEEMERIDALDCGKTSVQSAENIA